MDKRLSLLWASDGSDYGLSVVETMRQLVLPVASKLDVVTVAPLNGNRALLKRLISTGDGVRQDEQRRAQEAAAQSIQALGELDFAVESNVRWGSAAQEIVKEAADLAVDMIVVGAKPFNAFRSAIMDDTSLAVLKATHRNALLARPLSTDTLNSIVVFCNSLRWLPPALDLIKTLNLPVSTKIYLASFIEPAELANGLFFSYREYRRLRSEALSQADHEVLRSSLSLEAESLMSLGYNVETVIGEGSPDQGLSRLVDDVSASAVVVGTTPFSAGFFSSTADALNAALRVRCSVLVAR